MSKHIINILFFHKDLDIKKLSGGVKYQTVISGLYRFVDILFIVLLNLYFISFTVNLANRSSWACVTPCRDEIRRFSVMVAELWYFHRVCGVAVAPPAGHLCCLLAHKTTSHTETHRVLKHTHTVPTHKRAQTRTHTNSVYLSLWEHTLTQCNL